MATQKAWFYNKYGSVDVMEFGEFPVPKAEPGHVLIKVHAAALNPVDYKRREGLFQHNDSDFPTVPCGDMSGVVVEVGEGVTKFKKGDDVYGNALELMTKPKQCGTLAEYTLAAEQLLAAKPNNLSYEEAASLVSVVVTTQQAFEMAKFTKGQSVFIVGGARGVGSIAVQLAKHVYGASKIAASASTSKLDFLKTLGADLVVDYTKQSYEQIAEKFDFVFDTVGESAKSHVLAKEGAPIIDIAAFPPHPKAQNMFAILRAVELEKLKECFESGKVKAVLDPKSPFPFSKVLEAFKHLETGRARGKIVISPIS
ncbi:hypothetical protein SUGI_1017930 [Cryptomeria japonica]|uniref:2-methylene-furan-3-one reductase-like n=1 Tax=Cryptomeria japonica TaxID=3369 RepID=UPI0024149F13|nr:2-methylene-furan-3-one reductase-like [Cryptomeria japonica]GLJ48203.1 hypothetical protein SUGI_1017930 [Cryptomeria japonica]